ncbi:protein-L-isoaspartate(D-aspartate) O-methyltransferase [Candidatus Woesebacteria bacterium]|nr:protein-L-isoaspartate(D-aspartate) O-methyltransferase [Candidatus Woesebacteria bacterium]
MRNPREEMVEEIKEKYGLDDPKVFWAMLQVPREEFVPEEDRQGAYQNNPLPIGFGQTISQPYTVAFMTNILGLKGDEKVLEIGTGSGYQAAVLSLLSKKVYTIEIIPELAQRAEKVLKRLGYENVSVKVGNGKLGWRDKEPFDSIIITAGLEKVPQTLFDQLKNGGTLVAPVGVGEDKTMTKFLKINKDNTSKQEFGIFRFVPFAGV